MKKTFFTILLIIILFFSSCNTKDKNLKSIDFILDWYPNTNHTGLFVAKEKGYFDEIGINFNILTSPEDSTSDLIINNKAPFGIYFQDSLAAKLPKTTNITAVAAIIEHNTAGFLSLKNKNIISKENIKNKRFGSYNDPIEIALINYLTDKNITFVPNTDSNSILNLSNNLFDLSLSFYGYDKIMADTMNIDTNFIYLKDLSNNLDFYSPIIIANTNYLNNNKEEAIKILQAIKKGYIYAINNPEEAAEILIKANPELENNRKFIVESQKYLSSVYATNPDKWGEFDPNRWNNYYKWLNNQKILESEIPLNIGFSNEYIK